MDPTVAWAVALTVTAIVLAAAEIVVTGFFLAPLAVGAAAGAVAGYLGAPPELQAVIAIIGSLVAFAALRPIGRRLNATGDDTVGAGRLIGATGVTLEAIAAGEVGAARIDREEWRAETPVDLPAGTEITVTAVRGTRVVVTPTTTPANTEQS